MAYTLTAEAPDEMAENLNSQANVDLLSHLTEQQRTILKTSLAKMDTDLPVLVAGSFPSRTDLLNRYAHNYETQPDSITVIQPRSQRTGNVDIQIVIPKTDNSGE